MSSPLDPPRGTHRVLARKRPRPGGQRLAVFPPRKAARSWGALQLALPLPHKSLWACWQRGAHRTAAGGREQPPDGCTPVTNSDFRSRRRPRPRRRPSDSMIDATARAARVARPAKRGRRTSSRTTTRTTTRARSGASAHNVPTQPQKDLWGKGRASATDRRTRSPCRSACRPTCSRRPDATTPSCGAGSSPSARSAEPD